MFLLKFAFVNFPFIYILYNGNINLQRKVLYVFYTILGFKIKIVNKGY